MRIAGMLGRQACGYVAGLRRFPTWHVRWLRRQRVAEAPQLLGEEGMTCRAPPSPGYRTLYGRQLIYGAALAGAGTTSSCGNRRPHAAWQWKQPYSTRSATVTSRWCSMMWEL